MWTALRHRHPNDRRERLGSCGQDRLAVGTHGFRRGAKRESTAWLWWRRLAGASRTALAEAHDSGLDPDDMLTFSGDPLNLTLALPHENRPLKGDRDAADRVKQTEFGDVFRFKDQINLDSQGPVYVVGELQPYAIGDAARDVIGDAVEVVIGPVLRGAEGDSSYAAT